VYHFIYFDKPNEVEQWENELKSLAVHGSKQARGTLKQLAYCQGLAEVLGTRSPENAFKKMKGLDNLYELRPGGSRVLCCQWQGNKYVKLTVFEKDDNETRKMEIRKAEGRRDDWIPRHGK
jgi:mRNA-degrading endonuclease RelE of RelBE toxin-antitoxin system